MKNFASLSARSKKFLALAALFLAAQLSAHAVVDLGAPASATPYDRYLSPVKQVFNTIHSDDASMDKINALMREGRAIHYTRTLPYQPATPEETATRHYGDCKDKALWLMSQLQNQNVRFVIGKLDRNSRLNHAWLMLEKDGQWWILDCTMMTRAIPADRAGVNEYVPLFSYSKTAAYRHTDKAGLVAETASKSTKAGV
ncbi:MAG: transglutaminase-like domain-containing protein [Chthoniobacter sp.]